MRSLEKSTLTHLIHEIEQVNVKRFLAEVFTDHSEDRAFVKEAIVHGHKTTALCAAPARLDMTGNAHIHNVIEVGLELERTMRAGQFGEVW